MKGLHLRRHRDVREFRESALKKGFDGLWLHLHIHVHCRAGCYSEPQIVNEALDFFIIVSFSFGVKTKQGPSGQLWIIEGLKWIRWLKLYVKFSAQRPHQ